MTNVLIAALLVASVTAATVGIVGGIAEWRAWRKRRAHDWRRV